MFTFIRSVGSAAATAAVQTHVRLAKLSTAIRAARELEAALIARGLADGGLPTADAD